MVAAAAEQAQEAVEAVVAGQEENGNEGKPPKSPLLFSPNDSCSMMKDDRKMHSIDCRLSVIYMENRLQSRQ